MQILIMCIIYCQTVPLGCLHLKGICCENCVSGYSAFVNLSKSGNTLFRSMPHGNCLFSSASLSLVGDNALVHEL